MNDEEVAYIAREACNHIVLLSARITYSFTVYRYEIYF